jgi:hypothetical protein
LAELAGSKQDNTLGSICLPVEVTAPSLATSINPFAADPGKNMLNAFMADHRRCTQFTLSCTCIRSDPMRDDHVFCPFFERQCLRARPPD